MEITRIRPRGRRPDTLRIRDTGEGITLTKHRHDWGSIGQFTKRSPDQMTELKVSAVCWCFKCGAHKIGWDSNKVFLPSGKI